MTIVGEIMDGVVYVGADGKIALLNPVAEELLGAKSFVVLGQTFDELVSGSHELVSAVVHDHAESGGTGEISRTIEVQNDDNELAYVQITTSPVRDWRGEPTGILTVLRDNTATYKSDQLRNQFLSIVAHELRTPLTGIKTFSTLMAKGRLGELSEQQKAAIESIREQSVRLEHQIDKLINLGSLDANEYAQDPETLNVAGLLAASAAPFRQVAIDSGCEFVVEPRDVEEVDIRADRTDIKRVLKSLIENAVKFTATGGKVTASAGVVDGNVVFEVTDTGIGVDPRYHRRVFEKFFQVEDPLTRYHGGAGLGLFVAQGIIEAHRSRIEVESELGKGASFRFCLPVFDEDLEASTTCAAGSSTREGGLSNG